MVTQTITLTPQGIQKLNSQFDALKKRHFKIITDLKENKDEDKELRTLKKFEEQLLEDHLYKLSGFLNKAKRLDLAKRPEKVQIGSHVKYIKSGELYEATIVDPLETDPFKGYVSISSPIGKAMLGKSINDILTIATPRGVQKLKITGIV